MRVTSRVHCKLAQHPFPYIYMEQLVKYRVHAAGCLTRCPYTTNINRKYDLSLTLCKLLRPLKMIVLEATVCQRTNIRCGKVPPDVFVDYFLKVYVRGMSLVTD